MAKLVREVIPGPLLCLLLGAAATFFAGLIPSDIVGAGILALLLGMLLNPLLVRSGTVAIPGISFVSSKVLRLGIILMGVSLSFSQVLQVGGYALALMAFTLATAFGGGYLLGRLFKVNWKLRSLLSVSTAICGGSAVAAVGPVIEADDRDIAYAISATFLFDLLTVILFPWGGRLLGLSDAGFGLFIGTAVNDTSSVVAAGYAFSDAAGQLAVIVKLTRTLFIIPVVLVFAAVNARLSAKAGNKAAKPGLRKIIPFFILFFLLAVAVKSSGLLSEPAVVFLKGISKFFMVTALGAIGLKTSFQNVFSAGWKPMVLGVLIDTSVVFVALAGQALLLSLF